MKTCIQVAPIRIATYLLVMSLAIGCGNRHQPTIGVDSPAVGNPEPTSAQAQPTSEDDSMAPDASSNLFDNKGFPQKSCGDRLPEHENDYYVEFHPVFIDFSEENLQAVTSRFCEDAFKKYRENLGKNAIQVASFISRERAEQFKSLMVRELGSGDVGEVSIVSSKPQADSREANSSEPTKQPSASGKSPREIGKMAKLTDSQIDTLIAMDSMEDGYGNDMSVVLPTYLPKFEVYSFEFFGIRAGGEHGPDYHIEYRSSDNTCFTFRGGYDPPEGDAPTDQDLITVNSKALGEVKVLYTANSNDGGRLIIRFEPLHFSPPYMVRGKDETSYNFQSPSVSSYYSQNRCSTIPIQEAVKIIESLEHLNAESTSSN